jgi:hypothetical protein
VLSAKRPSGKTADPDFHLIADKEFCVLFALKHSHG